MIPDVFREIILGLVKKTKIKQVNWKLAREVLQDTSMEDWDFVVSIPNSSLNIYRINAPAAIGFNVYNRYGEVILNFVVTPGEDDFHLMNELLELARKKVFSIDDVIQEIKDALLKDNVLGEEEQSNTSSGEEIPF